MSKNIPNQDSKEKPSDSVLRNLLVSGHDSNKGHYVLSNTRRGWSPLSSNRKATSLDLEDHHRDNSPQQSPVEKTLAPPLGTSPPPQCRPKSSVSPGNFSTVSSTALDGGDSKTEEVPSVVSAPTLLLHPSSLRRLKLLRLSSPSANRSLYATRTSNGRLQLYAQPHSQTKVYNVTPRNMQTCVLVHCMTYHVNQPCHCDHTPNMFSLLIYLRYAWTAVASYWDDFILTTSSCPECFYLSSLLCFSYFFCADVSPYEFLLWTFFRVNSSMILSTIQEFDWWTLASIY